MFSSAASADPLRSFPHHERRLSDRPHPYALPPHPPIDLPRPLEPRSHLHHHHHPHPLQSPLSDAATASRRPAPPLRTTSSSQLSDYRPQTQSLPRLQDILTTASPATRSPPAYQSNWRPPAPGQLGKHANGDGDYARSSSWNPSSVQPPHDSISYPPQQGRRVELPILETSPVTRHDSHVGTSADYAAYLESARDHPDLRRDRPRQPSGGSYHPNGAPSPYNSTGTDDGMYRSPALERPPSSAHLPAGPETSSKYLGIREVPGQGAFHEYEGGYRIPTHVDGETVNPAWGLTKANKPRKRLAMACLDCREKKIKCEPGPVSCLQCEKAKRPCRKAPTHQSQSEPNTTSVWPNSNGSPPSKGLPEPSPPSARDSDQESMNKRRHVEESSPSSAPTKKHRSASPIFAMHNGSAGALAPTIPPLHHPGSPHIFGSPGKTLSWEDDPYAADPETTMHLLELYFAHVNNATYLLFPHHHFLRWTTTCTDKCQDERLVLYAMLAVGSIFADDQYRGFGQHCARIAADAVQTALGRFSMALAQVRLLLGLYHGANGDRSLAWDRVASGIHTATYLRFHTEHGCEDGANNSRNEFAFSREQLIECRRRTMWSGFLMDRYGEGRQNLICDRDLFIRLPCTDEAYERGIGSRAPLYHNGVVDPAQAMVTASSAISPMGWLIAIAGIWGDVVDFIHRAVHQSPRTYEDTYERFYDETGNALRSWLSRLPEHLLFNAMNVEHSIRSGYAGLFVSMHVLYHLTWLKMNRYARHKYIPRSIARNIRTADRHSHDLLQVLAVVGIANRQIAEREGPRATFALTTPFTGDAILAAIDVAGAGGLDSSMKATLDLINCGLDCLRELGRYWSSARDQNKECEKRYYQIQNVLKHPSTARSGCWLGREWGVHSPLEREFASEDDCIYGVEGRDYFDALRDDSAHGRGSGGDGGGSNGAVRMG